MLAFGQASNAKGRHTMKCPGQETQFWTAEAIYEVPCPQCGKSVEFYKDDTTRICQGCGHRFVNPKLDFGCASYCQFAEQCLGSLPEDFIGQQESLLKDKVAVAMKREYRTDFHSIGLGVRTARYAEAIAKEEGGNMAVILCSAYLNGIGRVGGRLLGQQYSTEEQAKSSIRTRKLLTELGAKQDMVEAVCALVGGEAAGDFVLEAAILNDAECLTRMEEELRQPEAEGVARPEATAVQLQASKRLAANLLAR
jgi:DNA-directed RNA polymerase subunit RPC12/RpoP